MLYCKDGPMNVQPLRQSFSSLDLEKLARSMSRSHQSARHTTFIRLDYQVHTHGQQIGLIVTDSYDSTLAEKAALM